MCLFVCCLFDNILNSSPFSILQGGNTGASNIASVFGLYSWEVLNANPTQMKGSHFGKSPVMCAGLGGISY